MNADFYWLVRKRKGGENNSSCNFSLISFRLTAHPAKSCDRYILTGVERDSGFTRSSNGLTLKWVYYGYGRTKANN